MKPSIGEHRTVTSSDGTTIVYERSGAGPALILIGGAFSDRSSAAELAQHLQSSCTVYCYDRRGRGDSDEAGPYSVEAEVDDLAALVAQAGGVASLYGHSSGAVLALEAAARGVAVARLAVYEPPYIVGHSRAPLPAELGARLQAALDAGQLAEAVEAFLIEAVGVPPTAVEHLRRGPGWARLERLAPSLPHELALCGGDCALPVDRLAQLTLPVLALDGARSPEWARSAVRALAALLPEVTTHSLEGESHGPDAAVLAPVLAKFFS